MSLTDMSDLEFWTTQAAKTAAKVAEAKRALAALERQHEANTYRLAQVK